ncbi:hypothetical protein [Nocardioides abyssi]|uniref:Uncharacterized protein n=1 Tax=Nocardioides abyssi TaxID=3058370 RepID=A0ABT8EYB0_9ACTN|nr:hypothetical protein [Nocardioides abyssi]MDN4162941.1 hypothetical protein [Nocardioides abyssi]
MYTKAEREALDTALMTSHSVKVVVRVTDLVGNPQRDVSHMLLGGQVDVDTAGEVSRTLQVTLFDPTGTVSFDSEDPSEAAMYMNRMIEVEYGVKANSGNRWLFMPIFAGPIVSLSRNSDTIEITCFGKEHLARGVLWTNFKAKKGANKVDVIKRLMREHAGETKFDLPELPNARLGDDFSMVALKQTPWQGAQHLARSMDRVLYYGGDGRLRLKPARGNNVFTFRGGDAGTLMSTPNISFNAQEAKNAVIVKGKKTKEKAVVGRAVAQRTHPLSPWRLGRKVNGEIVPLYLTEVVENDSITSKNAADVKAHNILADYLEQQVEIAFDSLPVPYLEEYDRVKLDFESYGSQFTLRQFSIPLTIGDTMTLGYNRRLMTIKKKKMPKRKPKDKQNNKNKRKEDQMAWQ